VLCEPGGLIFGQAPGLAGGDLGLSLADLLDHSRVAEDSQGFFKGLKIFEIHDYRGRLAVLRDDDPTVRALYAIHDLGQPVLHFAQGNMFANCHGYKYGQYVMFAQAALPPCVWMRASCDRNHTDHSEVARKSGPSESSRPRCPDTCRALPFGSETPEGAREAGRLHEARPTPVECPAVRSNEIRRSFLEFFRERGHKIVPSSSLIPDDPTLLLTTAGMVQFKPYFLGQKPIEFPRAASCQKSARTTDIERVGLTARHMTFFEMLGNFSFGDYFKRDAIRWAWELSTGPFGLDPDRIWVTVFESDDEAVEIWRDDIGLPAERIVRRGAEDNFWTMGVAGPGGPCSELFYDRGPAYGEVVGFQDGDRIMEYYNLVFTEKQVDENLQVVGDLPRKNVDTGLGLERLAQILQNVPTAYDTDTLRPILARAEQLTGCAYGTSEKTDISLRIITEHARAASFLIGDGVLPSNEDRGYVLRRLMRRAVRHAKLLGVDDVVLPQMVEAVIDTMGEAYPELESSRAFITQVVTGEEEGFRNTLRTGLVMLETEVDAAKASSQTSLGGGVAFKLHDTYGFPFELTMEIASEAGLQVDHDEFAALMTEQRERARSARKVVLRDEDALLEVLAEFGSTEFVGYQDAAGEARVRAIVRGSDRVPSASESEDIEVILDRSPFYPEGGGQVGDRGIIEADGARLEVSDTQRRLGDLIVLTARVVQGEITSGAEVHAKVDADKRAATERSHTATHILHATLRAALGDQARQAGSLVEPGRLRFDFSHSSRVPTEVLAEIEATVNARLLGDDPVLPYETTMDEARDRGAMMLFEEKYGDIVRVIEIGDYSVELCGGTHVTRTSQIGLVKVLGEASIGSNLRRIEALTGAEAVSEFRRSQAVLDHIAALLKSSPEEAPARVEKLLADLKAAEQAVRKQQAASERERAWDLARLAERIGETSVVVAEVPGLRVDELQRLGVAVRETLAGPAVVVLGSSVDERAGIVAVIDKTTGARGIKARAIIADAARAIGGGAGGKDEVATGGGNRPEGVAEALRLARATVAEVLA